MSENNEHINSSEFKKYLSEKTTSADKDAFEQRIEEGSFEEEALEGFKSLENDAAAVAAIHTIDKEVAKRTGRKADRKLAFPIWKTISIAASVMLFLGMGYFLTGLIKEDDNLATNDQILKPESNEEIAKEQDKNTDVLGELEIENSEFFDNLNEQERPESENDELPPPPPTPAIEVLDDEEEVQETSERASFDYNISSADVAGESEDAAVVNEPVPSTSTTSSVIAQEVSADFKQESESKKDKSKAPAGTESLTNAENNTYFNIAKVNFNSKNYSSAIDYFQSSIENRQNIAESNYYIGLSFYNLNKNVKANKYFDLVIKSNSSWVSSAKWYKVLIYEEKGDKNSAIELLEDLANGNSAFKNQALDKLRAY